MDSLFEEVAAGVVLTAAQYYSSYFDKEKKRTSILSGHEYTKEILHGHSAVIQANFRMPSSTLDKLLEWLFNHTELAPSRTIGIAEKLAMYMAAVGHGFSNERICDRFQHSGNTVSRCFHEVSEALVTLHKHMVQLPKPPYLTPPKILSNPKFTPYFDDCLGALDGTHVDIHVPAGESMPWRNRKGALTQNVLAVCGFDMLFHYVLPGWEGSAHDARVLQDAINNQGFTIPEGKYYLADAGYSNCDFLLIPYVGVRYHLKEQIGAGKKPENAKELFNLRHSQLRNVIERIFGVLKRRFLSINFPQAFDVPTQVQSLFGLTALHNFITLYRPVNDEDIYIAGPSDSNNAGDQEPSKNSFTSGTRMNKIRDDIAAAMWKDYQAYLAQ